MEGFETTVDAGTPGDRQLREAVPEGTDLVARVARADIESRLFGGNPAPVQVGRYRIEHELGTGGMGVVYRAHDPELARDVALKLLNPKATHARDPEVARGRLVREARAMARLSHPNVLAVHEVGTFEEQVYVAMEFVEGHTLADWLRAEPRTHEQILDVFLDAGRGLAAAHDEGIVHRDFKPENVMVSDKGRVHVLDFGLARGVQEPGSEPVSVVDGLRDASRRTEDADDALTRTGALVGTPAYMAPEQYAGLGASERSDQFSYCVALWEALHGARPFAGKTVAALADSVTSGRLEPIPSDSSCPGWVRNVLARGLAVDPTERYASMHDLLHELAKRRRRAASRRRTFTLGAMGLVLAFAGAATAIALAGRDPPPAAGPSAPQREVVVMQSPPLPAFAPMAETIASSGPDAEATGPLVEAVEPQVEPQVEPRTRSRTPVGYTHAYCYYEEDSYKDLQPQEGRRRFHPRINAKHHCWACELRKDTERVRSKVAVTDCRRYAACRSVPCSE